MTTRDLESEFDTVKDDLAKLRTDISKLSASLKDVTSETVHDQIEMIRDRLDRISDRAREEGREALGDLTDRIEDRPLTSVLIAFGVGVLMGRFFDR